MTHCWRAISPRAGERIHCVLLRLCRLLGADHEARQTAEIPLPPALQLLLCSRSRPMRGMDVFGEPLLTWKRLDDLVPANQPLRPVRGTVKALQRLHGLFERMCGHAHKGGRTSRSSSWSGRCCCGCSSNYAGCVSAAMGTGSGNRQVTRPRPADVCDLWPDVANCDDSRLVGRLLCATAYLEGCDHDPVQMPSE